MGALTSLAFALACSTVSVGTTGFEHAAPSLRSLPTTPLLDGRFYDYEQLTDGSFEPASVTFLGDPRPEGHWIPFDVEVTWPEERAGRHVFGSQSFGNMVRTILDTSTGLHTPLNTKVSDPALAESLVRKLVSSGDVLPKAWVMDRLDVRLEHLKPELIELLHNQSRDLRVATAEFLQRTEPENRRYRFQPRGEGGHAPWVGGELKAHLLVVHWRAELSRDSTKRE